MAMGEDVIRKLERHKSSYQIYEKSAERYGYLAGDL